jgi:ADP-ribosylation factor-binding protein GGA
LLSSTSQLNSARTASPGLLSQSQLPQQVKPDYSAGLASPSQVPQQVKPDYSAFSSMVGPRPSSQTMSPAPSLIQHTKAAAPSPPATDPFSAFSSPALRQSSPFQPTPQSQASYTPSLSFFAGNAPSQVPSHDSLATRQNNGANDSEEWTFSSALPEASALPMTNEMIVSNSSINVRLSITRQSNAESSITMLARFSNNTAQVVSELTFQVAVTKVGSDSETLTLFPI